mgnify:CR=1 FL=1
MTVEEARAAARKKSREDAMRLRDVTRTALRAFTDPLREDMKDAIREQHGRRRVDAAALRVTVLECVKACEDSVVETLSEDVGCLVFHRTEELDETIEILRDALDSVIDSTGVAPREIKALDGRWIGLDVLRALKREPPR